MTTPGNGSLLYKTVLVVLLLINNVTRDPAHVNMRRHALFAINAPVTCCVAMRGKAAAGKLQVIIKPPDLFEILFRSVTVDRGT